MKVECVLLTWHGTVVCAKPGHDGLVSEPLTSPVLSESACRLIVATEGDVPDHRVVPFMEKAVDYESVSLGSGTAQRAASGRGYHFFRNGRFLCASEGEAWVDWNRTHSQTWETFLPLPVEVFRNIVALRSTDWVSLADHREVPADRLVVQRDFFLAIGDLTLSLADAYPKFFRGEASAGDPTAKEAMFIVTHADAMHAFASMNSLKTPASARWLRPVAYDPPEDPDDERMPREFRAAESVYRPPLFVNRSDRRWFFERAVHGKPRAGYSTSVMRIRRAHDVHLLLGRSVEGTMFNDRGVIRHYGYLLASDELPRGLSELGDRILLETALISSAPYLRGDYLAFYNGNLQNYFHWLIEAVITLYLLHKAGGGGAKIVLPSTLCEASRLPYLESLDLFGLGGIEQVIRPEPVVKLERVYWLDSSGDFLENLPEHEMVALQAFIAASLGVTQTNRRVYVERENVRKVDNVEEVRRFFLERGFVSVRLEGMPIAEQARIFASAEFVAGPHGAGLSNLIFTPPHARVIEFIPESEMRSFFWLISSKMGHEYAMLPCPTNGGGFNGDMHVDMTKLDRLFTFLEHA